MYSPGTFAANRALVSAPMFLNAGLKTPFELQNRLLYLLVLTLDHIVIPKSLPVARRVPLASTARWVTDGVVESSSISSMPMTRNSSYVL